MFLRSIFSFSFFKKKAKPVVPTHDSKNPKSSKTFNAIRLSLFKTLALYKKEKNAWWRQYLCCCFFNTSMPDNLEKIRHDIAMIKDGDSLNQFVQFIKNEETTYVMKNEDKLYQKTLAKMQTDIETLRRYVPNKKLRRFPY